MFPQDDRPIYPHKITGAEVLLNPFDDIVPRETITNEVAAAATKKTKKGVRCVPGSVNISCAHSFRVEA